MMGTLEGKVALVTGASKGIGVGIAKALANKGAKVVVTYVSDKAGADKVVAEVQASGGHVLAVAANVTKSADIANLFAIIKETFGKLDILVNNAGIFAYTPLASITEVDIDRLFATNVKGLLLTTQAALALFPEEGASIVNIGALASDMPSAGLALYGATKGAVDVITRSLAKELGPKQIRVNCVRPGFTMTEGLHAQGLVGTGFEQRAIAGTPLSRAGQPDDIADIVAYLVSNEARWLTGSLLNAAGGLTY